MRALAAVLLALLFAGCASQPGDGGPAATSSSPAATSPPSASTSASSTGPAPAPSANVTVLSVYGTIVESGPDYTPRGGYCGRSLRSLEWSQDGSGLWFVGTLPDLANMSEPFAAIGNVQVRMKYPNGCEPQPQVGWADGLWPVSAAVWKEPQSWELTFHGGQSAFDGQPFAEGGNATVRFHEEDDLVPTGSSERDGHYVYDGALTALNLGVVTVHAVGHCSEFPNGCY